MKKVVFIILAFVLLFLSSVIIIPLVFKGKINDILLNKVNERLNAKVSYDSYRLTLLKSFPDFTASFTSVSVIGKEDFEGDTLTFVAHLSAQIDIMSVLKKEDINIKSIEVEGGLLQFIVNEKGNANWEIEKTNPINDKENKVKIKNKEPQAPLKFWLKNIVLKDVDVIYRSLESNYEFSVFNSSGTLTGEMEGMNTILDVVVETPSINFNYGNTDYLKNGYIKLITKLTANLDTWDFSFQAGETTINEIPLHIDGGFSMPYDSIIFNFQFSVPDIDMNQLFTLIPNEYQQYMTNVQAEGNINLNGAVHGVYYEDIYPLLDINFNILNGKLKYPNLPDELTIHELNANISKPEGDLNLLKLGISNLSMQLSQNPFKMHANFSSLFSDPHMDVALDGIIDMGTLSKVLPLGDTKMSGIMVADAAVLGNYSALEKNDFSTFISSGSVNLKNFYLQNSTIPQGVTIENAALVLQNQNIKVNGLNGKIGRSDFSVKGQLNRVITYILSDEKLSGAFVLNSNLIDANEFLQKSPKSETDVYLEKDSTKVSSEPLTFPKNMELKFNANIAHLLFDKMDISNFKGEIELENQQLKLNGLSMNMIDGQLKLAGTVIADGRPYPDVNFDLDVLGFDFPTAFQKISMVNKYMPFAAKSQGKFSTRMKVKSKLTTDLKMILSTISAAGDFSTKDLKLVNTDYFTNLKSVIQHDKLKNLEIDNFTARFTIDDGNLKLNPFKTKLAEQPVSIGGVYNLGGNLNFRVDASVDKALLASNIQSMIAYIPGNQNVKVIDIGLDITGDAKKPDVKFDSEKIKKQVLDQVKNSSKEDLENAAKKLLRDLFR